MIARLIGPRAATDFVWRIEPPSPARPGDRYTVASRAGRVHVTASSPVAAAHGAYAYLQRVGAAADSWEGRRVALPRMFPDSAPVTIVSPFAHRLYLNTCTFGYTTPWWDWPRWQREIDWMALRGIDMPLALEGQEFVWKQLWIEQGLPPAEVAASLSAPPFLPWQRMGNIEGYRAPLPQSWIARKYRLQRQILGRMRALGMTPVLPAFAGYVPKAFADRHPEARIYRMRPWEGFAPTYWLDPADPLFARLADRFRALYRQAYGGGRYYLADAFNEMVPPIADDGSDARAGGYADATADTAATHIATIPAAVRDRRLAEYGRRLYRSVAQSDPAAVWVMQGWLFGADKAFWKPEAIRAFLSTVPADRMMVLDIGNDRYPGIWHDTDAFGGKSWAYGYVHNYGGSNPVYGDLDFYRTDVAALLENRGRGRNVGFGMFPEGLHTNPIVYDYGYSLAWEGPAAPTADWIGTYLRARYGAAPPALLDAWRDIVAGTYRTRYWTPRWWNDAAGAYLLFKRPTAKVVDFAGHPGDQAKLEQGIAKLLALPSAITREPLFRSDLVDFSRHHATIAADALLQHAVRAYAAGDVARGDRAVAALRATALRIDHLLGHQRESLVSWIGDARAYATTSAEAEYYTAAAKAQIGPWGGQGHLADYASKAWQGLYAHYYLPRWTMFLSDMRAAAIAKHPFDEAATRARIAAWEQDWVKNAAIPRRERPTDPIGEAAQLLGQVRTARGTGPHL